MPHELSKNPICCGGESELDNGNSIGNGTKPLNMQPYHAVMKLFQKKSALKKYIFDDVENDQIM